MSTTLYPSCLKVYWDWYRAKFRMEPQFDGSDGKGLKAIVKYLDLQESGEENVLKNFTSLLNKYDSWTPFHRSQTRLRQISANISNIIIHLNGPGQQQTIISAEGLIDAFRKATQ
jgi:hypothetical protein